MNFGEEGKKWSEDERKALEKKLIDDFDIDGLEHICQRGYYDRLEMEMKAECPGWFRNANGIRLHDVTKETLQKLALDQTQRLQEELENQTLQNEEKEELISQVEGLEALVARLEEQYHSAYAQGQKDTFAEAQQQAQKGALMALGKILEQGLKSHNQMYPDAPLDFAAILAPPKKKRRLLEAPAGSPEEEAPAT